MKKFISEKTNYRLWLIIFICIVIPSILSSIIFYTREHYRILIIPFIYFVFIYFTIQKIQRFKIYFNVISIIILFYILIKSPKIDSYPKQDMWGKYSSQPNKSVINLINNLKLKDDSIIVFCHEGFITYFLNSKKSKYIHPVTKPDSMTFNEYIITCKINCIYFSEVFNYDNMYKNDTSWINFLKRPNYYGFQTFNVAGSNRKIFIKSSLLL